MKRIIPNILAASIAVILLSSTAVWAQGAVSQSGTVIKNHAAKWITKGVIGDAGPASGGNANVGISELPIVGLGKTLCLYDAPVTNALGYHQLCLGANVDGNALISLEAGGAATPNGLVININGTSYPFPGGSAGGGNVSGPSTSVIGHVPIFNNTLGTLLADAPATQFQVQGTSATATVSSSNPNYQPTTTQLSAFTNNLTLTGAISDTTSNFRDGFYSAVTDSDTTAYTKPHWNYGARIASFGPFSSTWLNTHKNITGVNAYAVGATTNTVLSSGFPPGVSGITAEAFQYGPGSTGNIFAAHNPSTATAQAKIVVPVQSSLDNSFGDADATHISYAFLATNISTKKSTAAFGASGPGQYHTFIDAGAIVATEGIKMPASAADYEGTVINYGYYNGNPLGGSFTKWIGDMAGGRYVWYNSGIEVGRLDSQGFAIKPAAGFDGFGAIPASGSGNIGYTLLGSWANGFNFNATTFTDAAIVLNTSVTGSVIKYDATNFTRLNAGAYELFIGGVTKLSVAPALTQISNTEVQLLATQVKLPSIAATPTGLQPVCIDANGFLFKGAAGAC